MLIDLNVRSHYSHQGILEPEEIILRAKQIGLDGVCFTENQPWTEWKEVKQLGQIHDVAVFIGLKLQTDLGQHLLFFPDPKNVEPDVLFEIKENADEVYSFKAVQSAVIRKKGIMIASNPYNLKMKHPLGDHIFLLSGLGAIEIRNGSATPLINDFALEASYHLKLPGVGGSDTDKTLATLGKAATLFANEPKDEKELISSIYSSPVWAVEIKDEVPWRELEQQALRQNRHDNDRRDRRNNNRDDHRRNNDRRHPRNDRNTRHNKRHDNNNRQHNRRQRRR